MLLDDTGKKRLTDKGKTNEQRFREYDNDLRLSFQNTPRQLEFHQWLIGRYRLFLLDRQPSAEHTKEFLAQNYGHLKPRSLDKYFRILKRFLVRQCGIQLDIVVQKTRSIPEEVEPVRVENLRNAIAAKVCHKATIERDLLILDFFSLTGGRCSELAKLRVRDVLFEKRSVFIKGGKGNKDRIVPLDDRLIEPLKRQMAGKQPNDSVFGLGVRTISNKMSLWGKKSGTNLHAHSLRHFAAEQLRDTGAPLDVIQDILGHESPETTRVYMAHDQTRLRRAVDNRANPTKEKDRMEILQNKIDKLVETTEAKIIPIYPIE